MGRSYHGYRPIFNPMSILEDIPPYVEISREEELRLVALAKQGDREATDRLVYGLIRLAVKFSKTSIYWNPSRYELDDLLTAATCGIIKAIERYDPARGYKLITLAGYCMYREMVTAARLQNNTTTRIPSDAYRNFRIYLEVHAQLSEELHREPTDAELDAVLFKRLRTTIGTIKAQIAGMATPVSLDRPHTHHEGEDTGTLLDYVPSKNIGPEDVYIAKEDSKWVRENLSILSTRERKLIEMRFGFMESPPMTLQEVGNHFNITRERARQIQDKALRKMRVAYKEQMG